MRINKRSRMRHFLLNMASRNGVHRFGWDGRECLSWMLNLITFKQRCKIPPPTHTHTHNKFQHVIWVKAYWTQYAWILIWKNRYFVANNGITLIYAYYCTKAFPRAYSNIHLMYWIVAEMANDVKNKRLPSWPLPLQNPITIKPASLNHQLQ